MEINIEVGLSAEYWDRKPDFQIRLNNQVIHSGTVSAKKEKEETENFVIKANLNKKDEHCITIYHDNKSKHDVDFRDGEIKNDLALHVEYIKFDDIDIEYLMNTELIYTPYYPKEYLEMVDNPSPTIPGGTGMGFNGKSELRFTLPIYEWFLDKI